ncbi:MAG: helix-turn-helix protein [Bacteroidetes bacterium]|nr:helix-turn-helix protein [Bacteroidota bacterium]
MKEQKHISILVPSGDAVLSSIIGTFKAFNAANEYMMHIGKTQAPFFKVQLVGMHAEETSLYQGAFIIRPHITIDQLTHTDLVIIPALSGNIPAEVDHNKDFVPWIIEQYKKGSEVASLCVGAFLLASTGLIDGKKCTTHWIACDNFRQMYPNVSLVTEKIVTDENGIYTSGGAFSYLNLVLYLIEKYSGRDVAIYCSKLLEVDIDRQSQLPFAIFGGQQTHQDDVVQKAQQYIEQNYAEKITIDQLADRFAISRRNLERRFKKASGNSPVEYIQRVKIEAAKKSFESSRENINEVMYAVGYSDSKAFRATFRKITGVSPLEYKQRYNREMVN